MPAPQSICVSTLSKAILKKATVTLSITDDQAGHVVERTGSGLKQVHDISGAKILVSTTVTAGFHLITIWGTDRQVGDAITAISKSVTTSNYYQITACTHVRYWASYQ